MPDEKTQINYRGEFPDRHIRDCARRLGVIVDAYDCCVGGRNEPIHLLSNAIMETENLAKVLRTTAQKWDS